nr:hypothetical protein BDOA9_0113210 [Bradyrhizobium sp. DOA9]
MTRNIGAASSLSFSGQRSRWCRCRLNRPRFRPRRPVRRLSHRPESRPAIRSPKSRRRCASPARRRGPTNCRVACLKRFHRAARMDRSRPILRRMQFHREITRERANQCKAIATGV